MIKYACSYNIQHSGDISAFIVVFVNALFSFLNDEHSAISSL